jgi:hypothetical protein
MVRHTVNQEKFCRVLSHKTQTKAHRGLKSLHRGLFFPSDVVLLELVRAREMREKDLRGKAGASEMRASQAKNSLKTFFFNPKESL